MPSLKGVWYRTTLEHSGSIASLEEWFDPARLRPDYGSKGWNPPDVKTRAIPGHPFGLSLPADDKSALIAFLQNALTHPTYLSSRRCLPHLTY